MAITKYGRGEIIGPDDDGLSKTAKPEWTEKDEKELEAESTEEE